MSSFHVAQQIVWIRSRVTCSLVSSRLTGGTDLGREKEGPLASIIILVVPVPQLLSEEATKSKVVVSSLVSIGSLLFILFRSSFLSLT